MANDSIANDSPSIVKERDREKRNAGSKQSKNYQRDDYADKRESIFQKNAKERRGMRCTQNLAGSNCISTRGRKGTLLVSSMGNVWAEGEKGQRVEEGDTIDSQSQWNLHLEKLRVIGPAVSKLPLFLIWTSPCLRWISIEKQFILCQRACRANWFRLIPHWMIPE